MDFSNLKYDISKVGPDDYVIDVFPDLGDYVEFSRKNDDLILRWVILSVDDGSPFFSMYRDFQDRQKAVYNYLNLNNPILKTYIDGNLTKRDDKFRIDTNAKIFKFFVLLDKHTYIAWYSTWSNYQNTNAFLQIQIDTDDDAYEAKFEKKQKINGMLPGIQKQLAEYEKLIFGDTKIKTIVTNAVAKITYWPEKMAKKTEYIKKSTVDKPAKKPIDVSK